MLRFLDSHDLILPLDAEAAWQRLQRAVLHSRLLNTRGFPQRDAFPPRWMRLAGQHAFATYEIWFEIEPVPAAVLAPRGASATRIRATTCASFPRGGGALYRAAVVGSGAHALVVRRFLRTLGRPPASVRGRLQRSR
jgi:hypothetical protein